jgi:hypothetical protein
LRRSAAIPGRGKLSLGGLEVGLGLLELKLEIDRVDSRQYLAGFDLIADLNLDRCHRTLLLERQLDGARGRDRPAAADSDRQLALADRGGRGRDSARGAARRPPPVAGGRQDRQQHADNRPAPPAPGWL